MTQEELIKFFKENMRIELDKKWRFEWDANQTLTVRIYIGDEKICGASIT